jgi:hypothetical protein
LKTPHNPHPKNVDGPGTDDIKRLDKIEFSHNQKHEYDELVKRLKRQLAGLNGITV